MTSANPFVTLGRFAASEKQALDPAAYEQQLASAGMKDIMHTGLAALGVGAAARGAMGLANLVKRHTNPPRPKYPQAIVTRVPVPVEEDEEKTAAITAKDAHPWYYPGMLLAGGAGLVGGWKGVDFLLEKQRTAQKEHELRRAKGDFEEALLSSYGQPRKIGPGGVATKTAAAELGELLDGVFDGMQQKQAFNWDNLKGRIGGMYGMYALATGIPAAMWQYNRTSSTGRGATLDKAMKLRSRKAYMNRPSEIYAVPEPVLRRKPAPAADAAALAEVEGEPTLEGDAPLKPRRRVDFL